MGGGGDGGVEGDDGTVCEAGAFAEGGWCCGGGTIDISRCSWVGEKDAEGGWTRMSRGVHTGCRCESEEGGEVESESSGEHGLVTALVEREKMDGPSLEVLSVFRATCQMTVT